jgi:adenosylmethionine-8-amino-7-oxononanoate aminotransferase
MAGFFITGTDTGVGKTLATAAVLAVLRVADADAVPMKPVQTGAEPGPDGRLHSPDLDFCLEAAGLEPDAATYALMNPYAFEPACSPHLAAEQAGVRIESDRILAAYQTLAARHDLVLVEGAGGVLVPLDRERTMLDLMAALGLPVLLVARSGLGTLNHTLLSLAAFRDAGLDVAGVIVNDAVPAAWGVIEQDNIGTLGRLGRVRVLGRIPHLTGLNHLRREPRAFHAAVASALPPAAELRAASETRPVPFGATWEQDRASLWHPYTKRSAVEAGPLPMIVRGQGVFLEDASGRRYLDAISSWWACALGHSHPRLLRALRGQAGRLQHSILGNLSHPPAVALAARLSDLAGGRRHVLFASDGACAVEAALKIAFQYWRNRGIAGRTRLAAHAEAYHGDTLGAMAAGFLPVFHAPFADLVAPAVRVEPPDCHPCRWGRSPGACDLACFAPMQHALDEHAGTLAAVIVEPLCRGSAGMRIYAPGYLRRLAECCRERRVLLIADEVAMGFGRTGRMFACEHAGIEPDIVCVGKALSGGCLPISATLVRDDIFETFRDGAPDTTFYHGHTFSGNPLAAAVALEALAVYEEERLPERAAALGRLLLDRLQPLADLPGVRSVRGLGLIGAVELGPDPVSGAARAQAVRARLLEQGILLRPLGPVLYLMPPLVIGEDVLIGAAAALARAVREG